MDDLISRQAAINAVAKGLKRVFVEPWDIAEKMIGSLPSAQPELDEWCTDCKEYDHDRHCCPRYNRVIRTALDDATPWKWTPVEDALPIKSGVYLVCNKRGAVFTALYLGSRWGADGVIAWMETPEPYKEDDHEPN